MQTKVSPAAQLASPTQRALRLPTLIVSLPLQQRHSSTTTLSAIPVAITATESATVQLVILPALARHRNA
jgi:hypothetical protein